jgi:hypothetical protein
MTAFRFFVILLIFAVVSLGWLVLGTTLQYRTRDLGETLEREVDSLWGPAELVQPPPHLITPNPATEPVKSEVAVAFEHHNRYKGLLWFSTYTVRFLGTYTVGPSDKSSLLFVFRTPPNAPFFENLKVAVDGTDCPVNHTSGELTVGIPADGKTHIVTVSYQTRGRDRWLYGPLPAGKDSFGESVHFKDFSLTATTSFAEIDYPKDSVSPSTPAEAADGGGGRKAVWHFDDYRTRQRIGIEMPQRQNPGPIAARMAFFAPVSLFFFFTVLFTVIVLKKLPLHPMHYLFISAGFFAFHILMAYLVDKVGMHLTFWVCAAVSVLLVVSYMRLVAGAKFAVLYVGLAQLVYLIGFSYAFFWEGNTGLTIVIVAILTLFVLMQATGRMDWNEVFRKAVSKAPEPAWTPVLPTKRLGNDPAEPATAPQPRQGPPSPPPAAP